MAKQPAIQTIVRLVDVSATSIPHGHTPIPTPAMNSGARGRIVTAQSFITSAAQWLAGRSCLPDLLIRSPIPSLIAGLLHGVATRIRRTPGAPLHDTPPAKYLALLPGATRSGYGAQLI
jgi:hypothetical protein